MEELDITDLCTVSETVGCEQEIVVKIGEPKIKKKHSSPVSGIVISRNADRSRLSGDSNPIVNYKSRDLCQLCKKNIININGLSPLNEDLTASEATLDNDRVEASRIVNKNRTLNNNISNISVSDENCMHLVSKHSTFDNCACYVNGSQSYSSIVIKINAIEGLLNINEAVLSESLVAFCQWYCRMLTLIQEQACSSPLSSAEPQRRIIRGLLDLDLSAVILDAAQLELVRMNDRTHHYLPSIYFPDGYLSEVFPVTFFLLVVAAVFYMFVYM